MLLVSLLFNVSLAALAVDENGKFGEIMVSGEAITDESFSQLKNFSEVNTLLVMNSKVTDEGLRRLREMKNKSG